MAPHAPALEDEPNNPFPPLDIEDFWTTLFMRVEEAVSDAHPERGHDYDWIDEEAVKQFSAFERDAALPLLHQLRERIDAFCAGIRAGQPAAS